jgi:putative oxygen-independent coproporphyrinogen III oxidase
MIRCPLKTTPANNQAGEPGLYVHVPFCQTKCPYCDFFSVTWPELIPAYLEALEIEASLYKDSFTSFDTLYLGGGTPSWLDASQLTALLALVQRHFHFQADNEFTIEANPDDVTAAKLQVFRDLGVNRLSLGVQSLNEAELRFLGRRHTAAQARRALELARDAGFQNLSADLMYGLPGQRQETWLKTLKEVLGFGPEHLSCYQLTLAPDTPLGRRVARGQLSPPGEEAERAFFLLTAQFLAEHGYLQYEVSNFAREERHYCRHNLKYWRHAPYLGLGPGAHSFDGRRRWWNFSSVEQYGSSLEAGLAPRAGEETLTPSQLRLEALYLGFRTREGVSLDLLRPQLRWQTVLAELTRAGLVQVKAGRVVSRPPGLVVADRLPLLFLE